MCLKAASANNSDMDRELKQTKSDLVSLQTDYQVLSTERDALLSHKASLESSLKNVESQLSGAESDTSSLSTELTALKHSFEQLSQELECKVDELADCQQQKSTVEASYDQSNQTVEELKAKLEEMDLGEKDLCSKVQKLEQECLEKSNIALELEGKLG